jgi:hypothetical protein
MIPYKQQNGKWIVNERVIKKNEDVYLGDENKDGSIDLVIKSLQEAAKRVPLAFRSKTYCEISSEGDGYGGSSIEIKIGYRRPATEDEIAQAEAYRLERERNRTQMELETLARLKAKYERKS